ncbi:MAG: hypothetical protein IPJ77_08595 [Planctomycetes bacterium]|nr:hypothetical protein [Planctomycetota bacterium]
MIDALRTLFRATLLSAVGLATMSARLPAPTALPAAASTSTSETAVTWICDRADNICGLDDSKMLSNPAKVDYDALLKATAEYKKIKDEKIDVNSAEGIQLRQKAAERVRDACEKVRTAKSYCSVWKTISHQDGRSIPDITDAVKDQL